MKHCTNPNLCPFTVLEVVIGIHHIDETKSTDRISLVMDTGVAAGSTARFFRIL